MQIVYYDGNPKEDTRIGVVIHKGDVIRPLLFSFNRHDTDTLYESVPFTTDMLRSKSDSKCQMCDFNESSNNLCGAAPRCNTGSPVWTQLVGHGRDLRGRTTVEVFYRKWERMNIAKIDVVEVDI